MSAKKAPIYILATLLTLVALIASIKLISHMRARAGFGVSSAINGLFNHNQLRDAYEEKQ
jgi:hypothetical protein